MQEAKQKNRVRGSARRGLIRPPVPKIKYFDYNGFGGVKIIIIIPAIFICRPYGTLEIIGNGVAINILSLAGHFSGFLPKIHYEQRCCYKYFVPSGTVFRFFTEDSL